MRPLIVFISLIAVSFAAETVTVNKDFNGREIKVRTGATIQVELKMAGAAGYMWEIQNLDKKHFEIISVKIDDKKPDGDLVGAPVLKTWLIRATNAGNSKLKFLHYRPWEGEEKAIDEFVLSVRIL